MNLENLKNCETINMNAGYCNVCKSCYYLSEGDRKCSSIQFCSESIFEYV